MMTALSTGTDQYFTKPLNFEQVKKDVLNGG
jgi:DNA-binding response OmpR family regulator